MSNLQQILDDRQEEEKLEQERLELLQSLQDLAEINQHLSTYLKKSEEQLDHITENIGLATIQVDQGTEELKKAQHYSFKLLPVVLGASVGAIIGGPFGLIPGFKAGGLITMGGLGAIGGITGYQIQK